MDGRGNHASRTSPRSEAKLTPRPSSPYNLVVFRQYDDFDLATM